MIFTKKSLDDTLSDICQNNFLNCSYIEYVKIHNLEQYDILFKKIVDYYKKFNNCEVLICNDLINLKNVKYELEKKEELSTGINFPLILMIPNFLISASFSFYLSLHPKLENILYATIFFYLVLVCSIFYFCYKGSKHSKEYQQLIIYIDTVIEIIEKIR
jgi:hypothetical protein